jgi:hypothetical protein
MNPKHPAGPPMTLGNMRALGVKLGLIAAPFRGRYPPDGGCGPKSAANSERPRAWFDCGSDFGNLSLALAAGWERRKANGMWLCPRCAHENEQGGGRGHADKAPFGKRPA